MSDKEYIVSIKVGFITPVDVRASVDEAAGKKGVSQFTKTFNEFKKKLNDIGDLEIEVDYVECQED